MCVFFIVLISTLIAVHEYGGCTRCSGSRAQKPAAEYSATNDRLNSVTIIKLSKRQAMLKKTSFIICSLFFSFLSISSSLATQITQDDIPDATYIWNLRLNSPFNGYYSNGSFSYPTIKQNVSYSEELPIFSYNDASSPKVTGGFSITPSPTPTVYTELSQGSMDPKAPWFFSSEIQSQLFYYFAVSNPFDKDVIVNFDYKFLLQREFSTPFSSSNMLSAGSIDIYGPGNYGTYRMFGDEQVIYDDDKISIYSNSTSMTLRTNTLYMINLSSFNRVQDVGWARSFVDPILTIDPNFSDYNNAQLIFSEGIGNGSPDPVPEPATILLLGSGLSCFLVTRRKKIAFRKKI